MKKFLIAFLLLLNFKSYSQLIIVPSGNAAPDGDYPAIFDIHLKGGYRAVNDTFERNAIPLSYRKNMMLVGDTTSRKVWLFDSLRNSWSELGGYNGNSTDTNAIHKGGDSTSSALIIGTKTNQNVQLIANNTNYLNIFPSLGRITGKLRFGTYNWYIDTMGNSQLAQVQVSNLISSSYLSMNNSDTGNSPIIPSNSGTFKYAYGTIWGKSASGYYKDLLNGGIGTITGITAGNGLLGGGTSGNITLISDSGRGNLQVTTGYDLNKVRDSLQTNINGKQASGNYAIADSSTWQTKYRSDTSRNNIYNAINSKQGSLIYQNSTKYLGIIYDKTGFASTNGFTNNGATVSASGNVLNFSGGAGNLTQTLDFNDTTCLERWIMFDTVIVGSKNSTSFGFGMGVRSINSIRTISTLAQFDMSSNAGSGQINIYTDGASVATSSSALSFSVGDTLVMIVERKVDSLIAIVRNKSTNSSEVQVGYQNLLNYPTYKQFHNTGKFSIYSFGGNFSVKSLKIQSNELVNSSIMCIGDSKTYGSNCTDYSKRWANLLRSNVDYVNVNAGAGDMTQHVIYRLPEILSLKPKQVILYIGINDLGNSISTSTWQTNLNYIVSQLQLAGISVRVLDGIYDATTNTATLKNYITSTFPDSNIIKTFDWGKQPSTLSADAFHPNDLGESLVYRGILASNKLSYSANNYSYLTLPLTQTINSNSPNLLTVNNSNTGSSAGAYFICSNGGVAQGQFGKRSTGASSYKTQAAADLSICNSVNGNINILNDYTSGNVNIAAGGASLPQFTLSSAGDVSLTGNLSLALTKKINVATGTNASVSSATFVNGTVTLTNSCISSTSKIFVMITSVGGTTYGVYQRGTTGTSSMVVNSLTNSGALNSADTSTFDYWIIN